MLLTLFFYLLVMMMVTKGITKEPNQSKMKKAKQEEKTHREWLLSKSLEKGRSVFLNVIDMELNIHSVLSRNFKYTQKRLRHMACARTLHHIILGVAGQMYALCRRSMSFEYKYFRTLPVVLSLRQA